MTRIALLRHGPTQWNAEGRLQGRRDTVLSEQGRAAVANWRLPAPWASCAIVSSPLRRCLDTVDILRANHPELGPSVVDARFVETDWGTWEGHTLTETRHELGPAMTRDEARGLDFRPDGGESPRDVQTRLAPALADLARQPGDRLVVAHRGVIRVIYAMATGWQMRSDPPDELSRDALHVFALASDGLPSVVALNLRLTAPIEA